MYTVSAGTATITGYTGAGGAITLPATLSGVPVTAIGASAFSGKALTGVVVPAGVTRIDSYAFAYCSTLATISLPASVSSIKTGALGSCAKLVEITVDPANASYLSEGGVLYNQTRTTLLQVPGITAGTFTVPPGVTAIADWAFWGCTSLTGVTLPSTLTSIGRSAFESCTALEAVTLPASLTTLGSWAFAGCRELVAIHLPAGVSSIGTEPFGSAVKLAALTVDPANPAYLSENGVLFNRAKTSLVQMMGAYRGAFTVPATVTSIGYGALRAGGLTAITVDPASASFSSENGVLFNLARTTLVEAPQSLAGAYAVPPGVTTIGEWAFYRCSGLTEITLPASLRSIGRSAFEACSGLTTLTFPAGCTTLDSYVLWNCTKLTSVAFLGAAPTLGTGVFPSVTRAVFRDPATTGWATTFGGVTTRPIGAAFMITPPSAQSVAVGTAATLSVVGTGVPTPTYQWHKAGVAIPGATNPTLTFTAVTLADAGSYSVILTNPVSPSTSSAVALTVTGLTEGDYGFSSNGSTATITGYTGAGGAITLPATLGGVPVTAIGASAFSGKSGLTSVAFPAGLKTIGGSAFDSCSGLTTVTLPASVTTLSSGSFRACRNLTAIWVDPANPDLVSAEDGKAVLNRARTALIQVATGLTGAYVVPAGITEIRTGAFTGASRLTAITFPEGLLTLQGYSFSNCTSLTAVTLPRSLTTIGSCPFYYCTNLTSVTVDAANPSYVMSEDGRLLLNRARTLLVEAFHPAGNYVLPATIRTIGGNAFAAAKDLTALLLPPGLVSVEGYAFNACTGLATLTLPATVTSLGAYAFTNNPGLLEVGFLGDRPPETANLFAGSAVTTVRYLASAAGWGPTFAGVATAPFAASGSLPNGVAYTVGADGVTLTGYSGGGGSVTVPAAVGGVLAPVRIAAWTFAGRPSLLGVTLPFNLVAVGDGAFANDPGLMAVSFTGAAPMAGEGLWAGSPAARVYFEFGTPGWGATFAGVTASATGAPVITIQPVAQVLPAPGGDATFGVTASGYPVLAYQWSRNGVALAGATNATLVLANVQPAAVGSYAVQIANGVGSVRSAGAALEIRQAGNAAAHAAPAGGYVAGQALMMTSRLTYAGTPTALSWSVLLPPGWSLGAASGAGAAVTPVAGQTEVIEWAWSEIPASPVTFSYTLNVPLAQTGTPELIALAGVRGAVNQQFLAQPDPLVLLRLTCHAADTDANFRISLLELTRVIELYNTRHGTVRTGAYAVAALATEDGYTPAPERAPTVGASLSQHHSADSNRDGKLGLLELTRVIELYNYRSGGSRTGQYKFRAGTEDGFESGP